ncbi:Malignant T-cell-amplified sequence 1 homolog [Eumeta japonica]|uniref:Malignant T-cell-amplified sequence 1 homolog n=1 Tax=Eumeta variegata TaxID=151549 RepID=A0A4C1YMI5_EUMVA|nr:Malignant T-cell-amplified sequence 1 homolog [Eumeta japonica]
MSRNVGRPPPGGLTAWSRSRATFGCGSPETVHRGYLGACLCPAVDYELVKERLDSSTRGAAGTYQEQTEKITVLPGLAITAPPRAYALCLGTDGTALFTALYKCVYSERHVPISGVYVWSFISELGRGAAVYLPRFAPYRTSTARQLNPLDLGDGLACAKLEGLHYCNSVGDPSEAMKPLQASYKLFFAFSLVSKNNRSTKKLFDHIYRCPMALLRFGPYDKFDEKESISGVQQLKSSVQKGIRARLLELYPHLENYIDQVLPKKDTFRIVKCHDHIEIMVNSAGELLFYRQREGPWMPTLRLLHKYPFFLPMQQVDKGAIRFVLSGANIMCPGLTSPGARMSEVGKGQVVAVMAEGKQHALAIGFTALSTDDIEKAWFVHPIPFRSSAYTSHNLFPVSLTILNNDIRIQFANDAEEAYREMKPTSRHPRWFWSISDQ